MIASKIGQAGGHNLTRLFQLGAVPGTVPVKNYLDKQNNMLYILNIKLFVLQSIFKNDL